MGAFFKRHWFTMLATTLSLGLVVAIAWNLWWGTHRLPVSFRSPDFALTDISGQQVTLPSLDHKIKVVNFIFTNCGDACPMTLHYMMEAQNELKKQGLFGKDVVFLSVTMDPENDSAPVLKDYSEKFSADLSGWKFLCGSRAETDRVMEAFGIPAEKEANGQYIHSNKVFLIDKDRNVRTTYNLTEAEGEKQITSDLETLAAE
jgi:protein SCO1